MNGVQKAQHTREHTQTWTHERTATRTRTHTCPHISAMGRRSESAKRSSCRAPSEAWHLPRGWRDRPAPAAPSARNRARSAGRKGLIRKGRLRKCPPAPPARGGGCQSQETLPVPKAQSWGVGEGTGEPRTRAWEAPRPGVYSIFLTPYGHLRNLERSRDPLSGLSDVARLCSRRSPLGTQVWTT